MARKLRVEYAGAIYHVMNRGDRRELIFIDDADCQRFVETLGEVCAKTGWQVRIRGQFLILAYKAAKAIPRDGPQVESRVCLLDL
jgi:hypothetical protein